MLSMHFCNFTKGSSGSELHSAWVSSEMGIKLQGKMEDILARDPNSSTWPMDVLGCFIVKLFNVRVILDLSIVSRNYGVGDPSKNFFVFIESTTPYYSG